jgi:hypothetical protein
MRPLSLSITASVLTIAGFVSITITVLHMQTLKKIIRGAMFGLAIAFLISATMTGPELVKRLISAFQGGIGESSQWGEPLFYLIVLTVSYAPVAVLGGVVLGVAGMIASHIKSKRAVTPDRSE